MVQEAGQKLLEIASYLKTEDLAQIKLAITYATDAHATQTRKSGEPYITHPIAVATELALWRMDVQSLVAALLHDVLEDTGTTKKQLSAVFGEKIADLVDGLSKLDKLEYEDTQAIQAENFRKMVLAMTKDIRVIIVKLSDRLHNMRTLDIMRPDKRRRIAKETLEIYAPIANRLGLNHVYRELQDLSFQNMYPARYATLAKAVKAARNNRRDVVGKILQSFSQQLVACNIEAKIRGREKNLYSIYCKMRDKKLSFSSVLDIFGFRIIVDSVSACYVAIGALHALYKPIPGKFKDYIAIPKSNGYQSLHTTLFGPFGTPIEVQVRTNSMDAVAEDGIASHWMYKSTDDKVDEATIRTHQWLQSVLDMQAQSESAVEFLEHVKVDLFPNEVYVFTPKGKIMVMPQGATPVDFAYAVHTDVGHQCVGARINHKLVPLRTVLRNGDNVEIITSTKSSPNPSWLSFVVTGRARSSIRSYLKNMKEHDAIALGERLLNQALSALLPESLLLSEDLKHAYLEELANKKLSFNDVLYDVGMGRVLPIFVARQLTELAGKHLGSEVKMSPVLVRGNESGGLQMARCCRPIPGDPIVALLIKDQGLMIHRQDCPNILRFPPENHLDANWDSVGSKRYQATIVVKSQDTRGLLASIASSISNCEANIESVETPSGNQAGTEGFIEFEFKIQIVNLVQLNQIVQAIQSIPQVKSVERR
ncbi:bifunctional (p)ppGpp synthetase/guanosine-3',5'-bis(diphosphate) 3'-pyrophosphohydrolase [Neisseria sp. Ec49-e6-T10]